MKEWPPGLNKRHKWFKKEKDFKVEDVVLVLSTERNEGNGYWEEYQMCFQENVRVAKIQIGDQEYIRPISKLCPLECKDLERVDKPEFIKE